MSVNITNHLNSKRRDFYPCKICGVEYVAEGFGSSLNNFPIRDLRLICVSCVSLFNQWEKSSRSSFLRREIKKHYGEKQYIYALTEPDGETIRYLGRTNQIQRRLNNHIQTSRQYINAICYIGGKPKIECDCKIHQQTKNRLSSVHWIYQLLAQEQKPKIIMIEEVTPGRFIPEREIRNICHYIQQGYELYNAEYQAENLRQYIKNQSFNFLDDTISIIKDSGFIENWNNYIQPTDHQSILWKRVVILDQIFNKRLDFQFSKY